MVVSNYTGAAVGSAVAGLLWALGGWPEVTMAAIGFTAAALAVWAETRRDRLAELT
jgi:phosphotransferase system  glucose/maltose/N-acetylglucosamine-specific IIC component